MNISKLGEFALIERLRRKIKLDRSVVKGTGDDCAVISYTKNSFALFSCDMIIEGIDFTRKDSFELIGRKALAISLSDIAACGGVARYAVVSLGLPKNINLKVFDNIIKGLNSLAQEYKVNIVGGDMSASEKIVLNTSVIGFVDKKFLVLRSGAKPKDIIFVSGPLGGSNRGKHLRFSPRLKEARYLVTKYKINAMIDISDGLLQDLGHILKASNTGAVIYGDLIPFTKDARNLDDALYTGEDFELLFSASLPQARKIIHDKRFRFIPIGEVADKRCGVKLFDQKGRQLSIKRPGFRHF